MQAPSPIATEQTPDTQQSDRLTRMKLRLATRHVRGVLGTVFMSAGLVIAAYALGPMGPSWLLAVGGGLFANGVRVARWRPNRKGAPLERRPHAVPQSPRKQTRNR